MTNNSTTSRQSSGEISSEIRAMAEAIGLTRLTEVHLQQLQHITDAKRAKPLALPFAELTPADEPANVFSLVGCGAPASRREGTGETS